MEAKVVLHLQREVYSKLPHRYLSLDGGEPIPVGEAHLRILGYEGRSQDDAPQVQSGGPVGTVLFSYEGFLRRKESTFLASFDLSSKTVRIFCSTTPTSYVGATLWGSFLRK